MVSIKIKFFSVMAAGFTLLLVTSMVMAQGGTAGNQSPQASFAGKYEGVVKEDPEQKLTLNLMDDSGKYSGTLITSKGSFKILKGQIANGVLTLEIEKPGGSSGPMSFRKNGDGLTASFSAAGKNLTVDFRKSVADEISGDWDAIADAGGQPFPFTLVLKLDGDKVTGSSSSQLGTSNISSGTWKDGKLSVLLDSGAGQIVLAASIVDGKLSGDYDFAGQSSGKWVAQKKKP
jgi:hypothetical protein